MTKILWIDLETTGLNEVEHGIVQLACFVEIDGKIMGSKNYYICPAESKKISAEALAVNGRTLEEIKGFQDQKTAWLKFKKFLEEYVNPYDKTDKFYFGGYNVSFDIKFLRQWWIENNDKYFGSYFHKEINYDPYQDMKLLKNKGVVNLENLKLTTVAEHFKINSDKAHNAMGDIIMTKKIHNETLDLFEKHQSILFG